ncbi:MAG: hypothetical protein CO096_04460 [Armatimonadetes bacterium CG_4_9_14_3_um_filter_66_14]|nr:hypothetical protein [Armatimonadota bacterium]NCO95222.1 hypothetical protein [Armatimonadota bacterium]NCQ33454.1 hypothetical protein [Armatimonadota bacterium]PJB74061.1 MAG: hypothetical protein CO096_04460 [Armatimonadetes bacterium CG_4_9_14_3_um_filter_66_14]
MLAIQGLYDGTVVRPLEPVTALPNVRGMVGFTEDEPKPTGDTEVMRLFGCLKGHPAFQGDAVELQRRWRDEWD